MVGPPGSRLVDGAPNPATATLTVDGEAIAVVPGESVAAALVAAGRLALREDSRGRPRGLLCGMGACFECRVSVDGGPPQRACLTPAAAGMSVRRLRYRERLASAPAALPDKERESIACDVLVIGAGPAGASAAVRLAEAGRSVVVVDERPSAGGQYYKQKIAAVANAGPDDRQYRDGRALLARLRASPARLLGDATVWGAFRDAGGQVEICATTRTHAYRLLPTTLIIATGATESVPPIPGWTLPGVMTTGAAQTLVRAYRVAPGQKVLVAGNGPLNLQLASELVRAGVEVVAVAESAPAAFPKRLLAGAGLVAASPALALEGLGYLRVLGKAGVPLFNEHRILRADGEDTVSHGTIARLDGGGRPLAGTAQRFAVDTICLGYRLQPSGEIARALGCRQSAPAPGMQAVQRDRHGQTSVPGVFAVGDGAATGGARVAIAEGRLVADVILGRSADRRESRRLAKAQRFQRRLWSLYRAPEPALPDGDVILCRCESVGAGTLRRLIAAGARDLRSLKSLSRAGMGLCQGRYCRKSIVALLQEAAVNEAKPGHLAARDAFATRNPLKPVTIADIAAGKPEWRGYVPAELPAAARPARAVRETLGEADVLVIGAGVVGTATALYLGRAGIDVMLVDRAGPNGEASGGNAGSLHLQLLPFDFDEDAADDISPAASTLALQKLGIELWIDLERELQADFELGIHGGLMLADSEADLDFLRRKAALERRVGVETEILSAAETRKMLPGVAAQITGAAFCAGEGKINPLVATPQLLAAALQQGVRLGGDTAVSGIDATSRGYCVATNRGIIDCDRIVNAAGGWSAGIAAMLGAALPVRSAPQQMLVTHAVEPLLPFLLSVARRHLTMKQTQNGNILIGGGWPAAYDGESRRAVTLRDSIEGNLYVAQRVLPQLGGLQLIRSWATTGVMIDGAPIVGELPGRPGFYNAVGANGYTMGPALGRIIADLILSGRATPDIGPFSVERFDRADRTR